MTARFGLDGRWPSFKTFLRLSLGRELRRGFRPFLSRFGEACFGLILDDDRRSARIVEELARHSLVGARTLLGALVLAAARTAPATMRNALFLVGLLMGAALFLEQRLSIGDGDLIVVRVNFGEGQKAVTVSAIVDEGGLKGRLNPRDLREINVAA